MYIISNFLVIEYVPETIVSVIAAVIVTLLTYIVIYSLKPGLNISNAVIEQNVIRISVINTGRFDAVNVRIEICAIDKANGFTYHFTIDKNEFLIIPSGRNGRDNMKTFKVIDFKPTIETKHENYDSLLHKIKSKQYNLRVRIHSYHSFSGLGKALEKMISLS